ncbi:TIGR00730 family Rossman fold protein [Myxococcota bacterium]|nr:TIGR00730 family Rossman fold protein [Myxococcota bacterium]
MAIRRVCVFCGSSPGRSPLYLDHARQVGTLLARRGLGLVYGGASVGLMGAVADAALEAGGEVTGVIPEGVLAREVAHRGVTTLHVVPSMHARKAKMAAASDAFVVLPGGFGTLEEAFEVITWGQLGIHRKPVGFLDTGGFYGPLLAAIGHAMGEEFISPGLLSLFVTAPDPEALLDALDAWRPRDVGPKWMERKEI